MTSCPSNMWRCICCGALEELKNQQFEMAKRLAVAERLANAAVARNCDCLLQGRAKQGICHHDESYWMARKAWENYRSENE